MIANAAKQYPSGQFPLFVWGRFEDNGVVLLRSMDPLLSTYYEMDYVEELWHSLSHLVRPSLPCF